MCSIQNKQINETTAEKIIIIIENTDKTVILGINCCSETRYEIVPIFKLKMERGSKCKSEMMIC